MCNTPYPYRAVMILAIVAFIFLLTACGGGDGEPGDTGPVHDISTPAAPDREHSK